MVSLSCCVYSARNNLADFSVGSETNLEMVDGPTLNADDKGRADFSLDVCVVYHASGQLQVNLASLLAHLDQYQPLL